MNRNPARPKRIMAPCTCASRYAECNCEWLKATVRAPGYIHIPLMVLTVCVVIVGLHYLFGG